MAPGEKKIRLSSGELSYFTAGEGRPLVHLHGAGGVQWNQVLDGLAASHQVLAPVVPGFDGTPSHEGVRNAPAIAALIAEFLDKALGKPCDVIGQSFGARVAMWLALNHAGRIDHLVLEGPGGLRRSGPGLPADPAELRRALFAHPEKAPDTPSRHAAGNARAAAGYKPATDYDEELSKRLPGIGCMTLILQGTADKVCPVEAVQLLKRQLPRSFLLYIWDAAHAIEVDQPERVQGAIESFLNRSEAFVVNWAGE